MNDLHGHGAAFCGWGVNDCSVYIPLIHINPLVSYIVNSPFHWSPLKTALPSIVNSVGPLEAFVGLDEMSIKGMTTS
ncbi:hypothetical protein [Thalassobacillus sp. C254]|uniref:hypothetical protein n=1 Tax=Thalassobacillus sp. C254 TaxID=1225341 RepID=UPI0012ED82C6|nr:hypothetical protein [Thalassobacillus sp. C254]